jgi:D-alanine-D-alanine ligase
MPFAELVFVNYDSNRPKIIDFKAKWEIDSFEYLNTVREFPGNRLGKELISRLREAALKCWHLFGLKGYARIDVRTDSNENVFVIEINSNPCISPDSGFVAATKEGGYDFAEVLQRVINDLNK